MSAVNDIHPEVWGWGGGEVGRGGGGGAERREKMLTRGGHTALKITEIW
jgi:hypothetical protein